MYTTPKSGYTCSQAADMAMKRLKQDVKKGTPEYTAGHDFYLKQFYHYSSKHPAVRVDKKKLYNSFVGFMITLWKSCAEGERPRLTAESIEEIMEKPSNYIARSSSTYSQIRAKEILGVSNKTINGWLNKEWLFYIIVDGVRKPFKWEIKKMLKYRAPRKSKMDSTIYKRYFVEKGVWPEPITEKGAKKADPLKKAQKRIETLEAQVRGLQEKYSGLQRETSGLKKQNITKRKK